MTKILCVGQVVVDQISQLNRFPINGEKVEPLSVKFDLGGSACCVAVFLQKMGIETTLIARIGQDWLGEMVIKKMKKIGIRFIPVLRAQTLSNHVLIDRTTGQRTIVKGKNNNQKIARISKEIINEADFIFCDRHETDVFKQIIKQKPNNSKVIIDPSNEISVKTIFMMEKADYPIVPIEFVKNFKPKLTTRMAIEEISKLLNKTFWVTQGNRGCLMCVPGKPAQVIKAFKTKAIDCLGAGDVFRGAFIFGLVKRWPVLKIMKFANAAAALQCTKFGNVTAIPTKEKIELFAGPF